jgi:hypothetical protein
MCLKSTSIIHENLNDLVEILQNLDLKPNYDHTFESGYHIQRLKLDTTLLY